MENKGYKVHGEEMAVCEAVPIANMTDIAKENGIVAKELTIIADRIHDHLFGASPAAGEKDVQPQCLMEELVQTNRDLKSTCEVLHKIAGQLGA